MSNGLLQNNFTLTPIIRCQLFVDTNYSLQQIKKKNNESWKIRCVLKIRCTPFRSEK
jgi:hypothetical protein